MQLLSRDIRYSGLAAASVSLQYIELDSTSPRNQFKSHVHPECEIYLNLSGDVSFMVENHIYPISSGDIIITRPYEYHHCIYHSNALHRHYWMLLSSNGNEALMKPFFDRPVGVGNLIVLSAQKNKELQELFRSMLQSEAEEPEKTLQFLTILSILQTGALADPSKAHTLLPPDLALALSYINDNFSKAISVKELATVAHVSVNTLERHFLNHLQISPYEFIKQKRLMYAAELLGKGKTVAEASSESGFADYSHFISIFKRFFGITPLQYKKQVSG